MEAKGLFYLLDGFLLNFMIETLIAADAEFLKEEPTLSCEKQKYVLPFDDLLSFPLQEKLKVYVSDKMSVVLIGSRFRKKR